MKPPPAPHNRIDLGNRLFLPAEEALGLLLPSALGAAVASVQLVKMFLMLGGGAEGGEVRGDLLRAMLAVAGLVVAEEAVSS